MVASLLLRIPTFSNYKLIVRDLSPEFVPLSLLMSHRSAIVKQCPNLFKDHLVNEHKDEWYSLTEGDQQSYPLHADFKAISALVESLAGCSDLVQLERIGRQADKEMKYISNRVNIMQ